MAALPLLLLPHFCTPSKTSRSNGANAIDEVKFGIATMATKRRVDAEDSLPALCPPPWSTRNEAYWMLLTLRNPLPAGIYDPLEASHPVCTSSEFKGGLGMIQIVRYADTPCGAYDELLIIPGNFEVRGGSQKGKSRMRISRIYVSQRETTYSGEQSFLQCVERRLTTYKAARTGTYRSISHASSSRPRQSGKVRRLWINSLSPSSRPNHLLQLDHRKSSHSFERH